MTVFGTLVEADAVRSRCATARFFIVIEMEAVQKIVRLGLIESGEVGTYRSAHRV